ALSHSHDVLIGLENVLSDLRDAETGQRGYLLTGNESYLEPYRRAIAVVDVDIERLRTLTADDPVQYRRVAGIRHKAADKLSELQETVNARKGRGLEAALPVVQSGRGNAVMNELRTTIGTAVDEVKQSQKRLNAQSLSSFHRTIATFSVATALALAFLG